MKYLSAKERSRITSQLNMILGTYDIDLYDTSSIRDYAYKEGFMELYNLISENPTKYFFDLLTSYE